MTTAARPPEPDEVYDACITRARQSVRRLEPRLQRDKERRDNGVTMVRERGFMGLSWPERRSFRMVHVEVLLQLAFELRYRDPREMLEHKLAYVAAVAGLDQAEVMLRQGKEIHRLATDILARFEEHAVDPEAVKALGVYEMLCANRVATVRATRTIRDYIEQFQDNPGRRFDELLLLG